MTMTMASGNNERSVLLNASRPSLFHLCPGQYIYLKIPSIDNYCWHPFSIVSAPELENRRFPCHAATLLYHGQLFFI